MSEDQFRPPRGERREAPTMVRLAGFAVGLGVVFAAALAVGAQAGPSAEPDQAQHGSGDHAGDDPSSAGESGDDSAGSETAALPGGLQVSQDGYTLALNRSVLAAGRQSVSFTIQGPDGSPVTAYQVEHDKELHLIAVRRDFAGYQHVHPARDAAGTWSADLALLPGTWRLFADFTAADGDVPLILGADVTVAGDVDPVEARHLRRVDTTGGYRVELVGDLTPGAESDLSFAVTRDGRPVADLEPYLGARGHLVALREGDLAYLHVHPTDEAADEGHEVGFAARPPSAGRYRLFLDFRHDGVVRTASFVLGASGPGSAHGDRGDPDSDERGADAEQDHSH